MTVSQVRMRKMSAADLPAVMAIEQHAFSNPWSAEMVKSELGHEWSTVLLCEEEMGANTWQLRAFAIFWLVADEVHVLNVATDQTARRRGFGRQVMDRVLATGRAQRCVKAVLEVRRTNQAAIGLYSSLGFRPVGLRPNYYQDDKEDAVVMLLDL